MSAQTYNGWANYETWNASLWINNDESMYRQVLGLVNSKVTQWTDIAGVLTTLFGDKTPDGVAWNDPTIDADEMNEMLAELID
tara:strand:- start:416 stop:664 length:249 start_codon:yes stop_codon:yes gene_type:complete